MEIDKLIIIYIWRCKRAKNINQKNLEDVQRTNGKTE